MFFSSKMSREATQAGHAEWAKMTDAVSNFAKNCKFVFIKLDKIDLKYFLIFKSFSGKKRVD